ncbi:TrmB family transcriptional regulator [[Eubacterium] cellulosolvens]
MESIVERLRKVGLTEYEAKVYSSLLRYHLNSASRLSERSGVPRTKIYSVLESLATKGWIKVYSGVPLLFKPLDPAEIFERMKKDYEAVLAVAKTMLDKDEVKMKEKFVISKYDVGFEKLKEQIAAAKTVWIGNATREFLEKAKDAFGPSAEVKVTLFPGESRITGSNAQFKEADIQIVQLVRNRETPAISVILDEDRVFSVFKDPTNGRYMISEMLYDDCSRCIREWHSLGWGSGREA